MTYTDPRLQESITRIRETMNAWGITKSRLAAEMGVSRQYLWQVVHRRVHISLDRAQEIEDVLDRIVAASRRHSTFGERLRVARRSAGLTLKEVAALIGYSWAGVERWEKDVCRPKPGVLWHLLSIYNSPTPAALFTGVPMGTPGEFHLPLHTRARALSPLAEDSAGGATMGLAPVRRRRDASGPPRPRRSI